MYDLILYINLVLISVALLMAAFKQWSKLFQKKDLTNDRKKK